MSVVVNTSDQDFVYDSYIIQPGIGVDDEYFPMLAKRLETHNEVCKPKVKHWLWTCRGVVRCGSSNPGSGAIVNAQERDWIQIPGSEVEM